MATSLHPDYSGRHSVQTGLIAIAKKCLNFAGMFSPNKTELSQLITCIPDPLYSKEALIIRKTSQLKDRLNLLKLSPDNICRQVKKNEHPRYLS